jgi:PAS domain S-box-containing protein
MSASEGAPPHRQRATARSRPPFPRPPKLSLAAGLLAALALTAFSAWTRLLLDPILGDRFPFLTFFWTIMLAAWLGGWLAGVLATLAAAAFSTYYWLPPLGVFAVDRAGGSALALFVLTGVIISLLNESWRRSATERDALSEALERRVAHERLGAERMRLALEASPAAMLLVDSQGRVVFCNDAAQRLFGYPARELTGLEVEALVPAPLRGRHLGHRRNFSEERAARPMGSGLDLLAVRKDGSQVAVEIGLSPLELEGERLVIAAVTDVSHQRAALQVQTDAATELQQANRLKDDFLSVLSHELRTPLNATMGWASLLAGGLLDATAQREAAEAILRSARAEARLVDSLLDLSRIMAGKLQVDPQPTDLARVVRTAVETLRPEVEVKGLDLHLHLPPAPIALEADEARLQQIVWNLVSNAVKFTPRGGRIDVAAAAVGGRARVEVRDTGRGIRAEFLPHLFERFAQEIRDGSRARAGLGLGLAITQELARAHGGEVRAASPGENQGSVFTLELPLRPAGERERPGAHAKPTPPPAARSIAGVDVLVVDDDADSLAVVARALAAHGAVVRTATAAPAAYQLFLERRPRVVVADLRMPEEDGFSLISRLRSLAAERGQPPVAVAALTAEAGEAVRRATAEAGFDGYLAKPASAAALVRLVADLCRAEATSGEDST